MNIINCGQGWKKIYQPVIDEIVSHDLKKSNVSEKIGIESINESDGALVIKVINERNLTAKIRKDIIEAKHESLETCCFCGNKENVGTTMNFEYKTCCKDCWSKEILLKNKESIWKCYETNKFYKKNI